MTGMYENLDKTMSIKYFPVQFAKYSVSIMNISHYLKKNIPIWPQTSQPLKIPHGDLTLNLNVLKLEG